MKESILAMDGLMDNFYTSETQFNSSKNSVLRGLESERITRTNIYHHFLQHKRWGLDEDVRKKTFDDMKKFTIRDLEEFHKLHIAGKNFSYCVIGDKKILDMEYLKSVGKVNELSLEEIFGY